MIDLKFRNFNFKIERNNQDGSKSKLALERLNVHQEMTLLGLIDSTVDRFGYQDADKLITYIKSKE
jgi:hypothetical protein